MNLYGIIGWKNAGKTGLMERLVAELSARGYRVATVKHVHHDVDLDQPGKDSFRHRAAGAVEVALTSARRSAILTEHRGPEPELADILVRLAPADLILVEGYKRDRHRKIEVFRAPPGNPLIQPGDPTVRAVASDIALPDLGVPLLDLNDTAAVADFILADLRLPARLDEGDDDARFETVAVLDWSASAAPGPARPAADAIWLGVTGANGTDAHYFRTRAEAEAALARLISAEADAGRRLLVGCDFPFAYPAGTARRLTGRDDARAVWAEIAARLLDGPDNRNNRFDLAAQLNRRLGGGEGPGPFWGRPAGQGHPDLPPTRPSYPAAGLPERRAVEALVPRTSPVWKLYTVGSVGGQTLTGLPMLHRLSARPGVAVWPFDRTAGAMAVLAEIYPSLVAPAVAASGDAIRDRAQVRLLSRALWSLSRSGTLGRLWRVPAIARTEGWILGAGAADALAAALVP
jgi:molybdopterin-guanine dinucleotide biosynthesis adapter protein